MKNYAHYMSLLAVICVSQHTYSMDRAMSSKDSINTRIQQLKQQKEILKKETIIRTYPVIEYIGKEAGFNTTEYLRFFKKIQSVSDEILINCLSIATKESYAPQNIATYVRAHIDIHIDKARKSDNSTFTFEANPAEQLQLYALVEYTANVLHNEPYKTYLHTHDSDVLAYLTRVKTSIHAVVPALIQKEKALDALFCKIRGDDYQPQREACVGNVLKMAVLKHTRT